MGGEKGVRADEGLSHSEPVTKKDSSLSAYADWQQSGERGLFWKQPLWTVMPNREGTFPTPHAHTHTSTHTRAHTYKLHAHAQVFLLHPHTLTPSIDKRAHDTGLCQPEYYRSIRLAVLQHSPGPVFGRSGRGSVFVQGGKTRQLGR